MSADVRTFGVLDDGRAVRAVRLGAEGGLRVEVIEFGASLSSIVVPPTQGPPIETLLTYDDLQGFVDDRMFHGRLVGRVANRIANARFELDGETYHTPANQAPNTLHGGAIGWGGRLWRLEAADARRAALAYTSPDLDEGFPGEVEARVELEVSDDTLDVVWTARADRPTPLSLTYHPYFNLSGRARTPVLDHLIQVRAEAVTPVKAGLIPTGELMPVERTPFDLRRPRRIGDCLAMQHQQLVLPRGFDLNWVLDAEREGPAATLRSPESGVGLELETDQPGLQIYSGQGLGHPFIPHGAVVLEPQDFPNAVNQSAFPSVILKPGEPWRRFVRYRFHAGPPGAE